ncbi:hypothetical protein EVJ58_g6564 [Rhodofomes roseus]|uniref:Uncharacterized protein n=1 Tax=Rhodofomes roseus TaxID=34475 RepID=A0A4Y9Y770_9APHY|nr:hypothetical protein EVJ58_g6564 [Rhodofomes roseus]
MNATLYVREQLDSSGPDPAHAQAYKIHRQGLLGIPAEGRRDSDSGSVSVEKNAKDFFGPTAPVVSTQTVRAWKPGNRYSTHSKLGGVGAREHYNHKAQARYNFFYQVSNQDHARFRGEAASWFKDLVNVRREPESLACCWRSLEDTASCNGTAQLIDLHFSLPIMFIIEIGSDADKTWDFPPALDPLSQDEDEGANPSLPITAGRQVEYDLVGRLFYDEMRGHFFCQSVGVPDLSVYEYDGLASKGIRRFKSGGGAADLAGPYFEPPRNSCTQAVVYHLRGGKHAQETLSSHQRSLVERYHALRITTDEYGPGVQLQKPGFAIVPVENRPWLRSFPSRGGTLEYEAGVA